MNVTPIVTAHGPSRRVDCADFCCPSVRDPSAVAAARSTSLRGPRTASPARQASSRAVLRIAMLPVFLLAAAATSGCVGNPIVGRWSYPTSTSEATIEFDFDASGAFSVSTTGAGVCTGTVTLGGYTWTTSGDTIALTGSATCSGAVTCTVGGVSRTIDCATVQLPAGIGTATFALGSDDDTLTLVPSAVDGGTPPSPFTLMRLSH